EIVLEECARLVALERASARKAPADLLERGCDRPAIMQLALTIERLTTGPEHRKRGVVIIRRPPIQVRPSHRLELRVRDAQRIDELWLSRGRHARAGDQNRRCRNPSNRRA